VTGNTALCPDLLSIMLVAREENTFPEFLTTSSESEDKKSLPRCSSDPTSRSSSCSSRGQAQAVRYNSLESDCWKAGAPGKIFHMPEWTGTPAYVVPVGTSVEPAASILRNPNSETPTPHDEPEEQSVGKSSKSRPDKQQRARFRRFIEEQKALLAAQPHDYDIEAVQLPASLQRADRVQASTKQVHKELYVFRETLKKWEHVGGTWQPQQHFSFKISL